MIGCSFNSHFPLQVQMAARLGPGWVWIGMEMLGLAAQAVPVLLVQLLM
jgi:hypothetical protein